MGDRGRSREIAGDREGDAGGQLFEPADVFIEDWWFESPNYIDIYIYIYIYITYMPPPSASRQMAVRQHHVFIHAYIYIDMHAYVHT